MKVVIVFKRNLDLQLSTLVVIIFVVYECKVGDSEQYIIVYSNLYLFQSPVIRNWVTHYRDVTSKIRQRERGVRWGMSGFWQRHWASDRSRRQKNNPFVLRCTIKNVANQFGSEGMFWVNFSIKLLKNWMHICKKKKNEK